MLYPLRGQLTCKTHSQDNTLEQTAHVILTILLTILKKKKKLDKIMVTQMMANHSYV